MDKIEKMAKKVQYAYYRAKALMVGKVNNDLYCAHVAKDYLSTIGYYGPSDENEEKHNIEAEKLKLDYEFQCRCIETDAFNTGHILRARMNDYKNHNDLTIELKQEMDYYVFYSCQNYVDKVKNKE